MRLRLRPLTVGLGRSVRHRRSDGNAWRLSALEDLAEDTAHQHRAAERDAREEQHEDQEERTALHVDRPHLVEVHHTAPDTGSCSIPFTSSIVFVSSVTSVACAASGDSRAARSGATSMAYVSPIFETTV